MIVNELFASPTGRLSSALDPNNHNFSYGAQALSEGAAQDLASMTKATKLANDFRTWLSRKNEERPLEDVLHRWAGFKGRETLLYANAEAFGGPDDLMIGFAFGGADRGEGGFVTGGKNTTTGKNTWFAILRLDHDPSKETDVAWSLGSKEIEFLVHEITHYYDRSRQTTPTKGSALGVVPGVAYDRDNPATYFNSPIEFNAYFQQGLHKLMHWHGKLVDKSPALVSFDAFKKHYMGEFDKNFVGMLNDENKQRFERRLYKLWNFLKEKDAATPSEEDFGVLPTEHRAA
jgi:hypothetical protein